MKGEQIKVVSLWILKEMSDTFRTISDSFHVNKIDICLEKIITCTNMYRI